jgi:hypothetical protein
MADLIYRKVRALRISLDLILGSSMIASYGDHPAVSHFFATFVIFAGPVRIRIGVFLIPGR